MGGTFLAKLNDTIEGSSIGLWELCLHKFQLGVEEAKFKAQSCKGRQELWGKGRVSSGAPPRPQTRLGSSVESITPSSRKERRGLGHTLTHFKARPIPRKSTFILFGSKLRHLGSQPGLTLDMHKSWAETLKRPLIAENWWMSLVRPWLSSIDG